MRKAIIAITAGLLLVAGQAAASGSNIAVTRVGDRLGARTTVDAQLEPVGSGFFFGIPAGAAIIGAGVLIGAAFVASKDSSP